VSRGARLSRVLCVAVLLTLTGGAAISCSDAGAPQDLATTSSSTSTSTSTTLDAGLDYDLVFTVSIPGSASLYNTYLVPWTETVSGASDGRVTFDIAEPPGLPKDEAQPLKDVLDGRADLTVFEPSWAPGGYPLLELASLPMLFPDPQTAVRVMLQLVDEYGQDAFEGLHVLGFMSVGGSQYGGIVPVRAPSDLSGLKIRVGSDLESDIVTALGGLPVDARSVAALEISLPRMEFDGLFLSWMFHAGNTNHWATYWTTCDLYLEPYLLVMNQDKWDSLPAVVQKAFTDNSGVEASVKYLADEAKYEYDNSLLPTLRDRGYDYLAVKERAREVGHPIYVLDEVERAEWREAVQPVWQDWLDTYAEQLPTQEILDRALELIEEYSAG